MPLPPSSNASSARSRVDSKSLHQNRNQRFCIKNNLLGGRKINPRKLNQKRLSKEVHSSKMMLCVSYSKMCTLCDIQLPFFFLYQFWVQVLSKVFGVRGSSFHRDATCGST